MGRADFTLSAGPNNVSAEVRGALGSPILYHGVDAATDLPLAEGVEASIARHAGLETAPAALFVDASADVSGSAGTAAATGPAA